MSDRVLVVLNLIQISLKDQQDRIQLLCKLASCSVVCVFIALSSTIKSNAQPLFDSQNVSSVESTVQLDAVELEIFFDGLFQGLMDTHHIPGGVVAVVQGDSLVLAKGYGHANIEEQIPVQPDSTIFRVASISKLFIWTAIMQLVDAGKLDLNTDLNTYLTEIDVKVPDTFNAPVTLGHLMTHTAGFESRYIGRAVKSPSELLSRTEVMREQMPERVRAAGQVASYSNHGSELAALVVEAVTGQSYEDYVVEHILRPLGMKSTNLRQQIPEHIQERLATGYAYQSGALRVQQFHYTLVPAAGAMTSTAMDMARFMRAHLNAGRLGEVEILDSLTTRRMQSPLFEPAPGVSPIAHGFYGSIYASQPVIRHSGDISGFHSDLVLIPEQQLGLFLSFNGQGGNLRESIIEAFMRRYFGNETTMSQSFRSTSVDRGDTPAWAEDLTLFTGSYVSARRVHSTLAKLGALLFAVEVEDAGEGQLRTHATETITWIPTDRPLLFREKAGDRTLSFLEGNNGHPAYFYYGNIPIIAFERAPLRMQMGFNLLLLLGTGLLMFSAVIVGPVAAFVRNRFDVSVRACSPMPLTAYGLSGGASLLLLVFIFGLIFVLLNPLALYVGLPGWFQTLLVVPFIAMAMIAVNIYLLVRSWMSGTGRLSARIYISFVTLACVAVLWQLHYWNLLGFYY